jgi:hypothetical protein
VKEPVDANGLVEKTLRKYTSPDEALGMWGWMPSYYVDANLRQATRKPFGEIAMTPYTGKLRQIYLDDLRRSLPPVFIDATGPGNFWYFDRRSSFENTFPPLAAFIRNHYVLDGEINGARLYVRSDRWTKRQAPSASP